MIGIFGNLFQVRQSFQWIRGKHTFKAGGEWRGNRDNGVFGLNPNGGYQFGGGTAYATAPIVSTSGLHNIAAGQPLPDALSGLLEADAFSFTQAVAPPIFSQGAAIGDSAIRRDAYNFYFQDTWKLSDRLTVNATLRYEIESRIREAKYAHLRSRARTQHRCNSGFRSADQSQPGIQTRIPTAGDPACHSIGGQPRIPRCTWAAPSLHCS